jgi:short-subunit dehydrogenase
MKMAPVENVAREILAAVEAGKTVAYVPRRWRLIMLVIKHLPEVLFNQLHI